MEFKDEGERKRFYREKSAAFRAAHPDYYRNYILKWKLKNPDKAMAYRRAPHRKALEVVSRGKMACVYCGCDDIRILEINHKKGGGGKETERGSLHTPFYYAIIQGKRPIDDLEVVCKICNIRHFVTLRFPDLVGRFKIEWRP